MNYKIQPLTPDDMRSVSTNYLRACLKEDLPAEEHDQITKELYVRETRRPIT